MLIRIRFDYKCRRAGCGSFWLGEAETDNPMKVLRDSLVRNPMAIIRAELTVPHECGEKQLGVADLEGLTVVDSPERTHLKIVTEAAPAQASLTDASEA